MKKTKLMNNVRASDFKNLDILPAHMSYRNFDVMLDAMKKSTQRLRSQLGSLKKEYDAVILDCPPNISKLAENIFEASDLMLVPVIPTTLSERTLSSFRTSSKKTTIARKSYTFSLPWCKRIKLHSQTVSRMASTCKRVLESHILFSSDVESMGIHRRPIAEYRICKAAASSSYKVPWHRNEKSWSKKVIYCKELIQCRFAPYGRLLKSRETFLLFSKTSNTWKSLTFKKFK